MSEVAVKLTNMRAIPMLLPDGQGNTVELAPGESKIVWGDYMYFRRMPEQGVSGLVVKKEEGQVRLVEDVRRKDVGIFRITNNRQIPMLLATGVERRKHVEIPPGATVEVVARESVVKQMSGITVNLVKSTPTPPPAKREPSTPPVKRAPPKVKFTSPTLAQDLAAARAKVPPAVAPPPSVKTPPPSLEQDLIEALAKKPPADATPPLTTQEEVRTTHGLPGTREEWQAHAKGLTWHDLRGIAKELGVRGRGRDGLSEAIGVDIYGG